MVPRTSTPRSAAIYCRISSDPSETRLGVDRQESDCRALADRKGWPVAAVLVDNDTSAASGKPRPQYQRLLAGIEAGDIDGVIAWDLDRLHRRPMELEEFFQVCDTAGMRHLASVGGDVDLANGNGVMVARIKGAVAAEEVRKIRERTRRKKLEIAESGRPSGGGRRPFGYSFDGMEVDEVEAEAVRDAARRVIVGEPLMAIARDWNKDGPLPVCGKIWRTNAIFKVLCAPRSAGLRQHQGEIIGIASWPAILDRATWETVCAVLKDPARRTNMNARTYLLSGGIVRCGACDGNVKMVGKPQRPGKPAYACLSQNGGCDGNSILAVPVEELVVEMVLQASDSPAFAQERAAKPDGNDEASVIEDAEAKLKELAEMWAAGVISRQEWMAARKPLDARLDAARRAMARHRGSTGLDGFVGHPGALRAEWEGLNIERRRAVIAAAVDRVIVTPGKRGYNRFDPSRVDLRWRS